MAAREELDVDEMDDLVVIQLYLPPLALGLVLEVAVSSAVGRTGHLGHGHVEDLGRQAEVQSNVQPRFLLTPKGDDGCWGNLGLARDVEDDRELAVRDILPQRDDCSFFDPEVGTDREVEILDAALAYRQSGTDVGPSGETGRERGQRDSQKDRLHNSFNPRQKTIKKHFRRKQL